MFTGYSTRNKCVSCNILLHTVVACAQRYAVETEHWGIVCVLNAKRLKKRQGDFQLAGPVLTMSLTQERLEGQISEATEGFINDLVDSQELPAGRTGSQVDCNHQLEDTESLSLNSSTNNHQRGGWEILKDSREPQSNCSEISEHLQSIDSFPDSLEGELCNECEGEEDQMQEFSETRYLDKLAQIRKLKRILEEKNRVIVSLKKQIENSNCEDKRFSRRESCNSTNDSESLEDRDGAYDSDCSASLSMYSIWSTDISVSATRSVEERSSKDERAPLKDETKITLKKWVREMDRKDREVDSVVRKLRKLQLHRHQGIVSLCDHVAQQSSVIVKLKNTLLGVLADNRSMKQRLKTLGHEPSNSSASESVSVEAVNDLCDKTSRSLPSFSNSCEGDESLEENQPYFLRKSRHSSKGPLSTSNEFGRRSGSYVDPTAPKYSRRDFGSEEIIRVLQETVEGLTKDLCRSEEAKQAYQQQSLELSRQIENLRSQLEASYSNKDISEEESSDETEEEKSSPNLTHSYESSCSYQGYKSFQPPDPASSVSTTSNGNLWTARQDTSSSTHSTTVADSTVKYVAR